MENASKALIIAGAILIAIVLITLGVVILQQGNSTTDAGGTALNSREIESFNSQFRQYEGEAISGTKVRTLINAINSNNSAQFNNGGGHGVEIVWPANTTTVSQIKPGSTYEVKAEDTGKATVAAGGEVSIDAGNDKKDGYIDKITITKK